MPKVILTRLVETGKRFSGIRRLELSGRDPTVIDWVACSGQLNGIAVGLVRDVIVSIAVPFVVVVCLFLLNSLVRAQIKLSPDNINESFSTSVKETRCCFNPG